MDWKLKGCITGVTSDFKFTSKFAGFDLDSTLIKTKSGKKFAKDSDDWIFFSDNVESRLKQLNKDNYCIVIITNQAGLSTDTKINAWKQKVDSIVKRINLPIKVFCSVSHDIYRKPLPSFMEEYIRPFVKDMDMEESFYCGDACGRDGDHSDCDYKFALNSKLKFRLPEDVFDCLEGDIPVINYPILDLVKMTGDGSSFVREEKEMILMVGYPGAGKSRYVNDVLVPKNYVRINQDVLKTAAKCLKEATKALSEGKNVVIDNTNYDKSKRAQYIKLAKSYGYTVRCIIIDTPYELALHNATYRAYKKEAGHIPEIAYRLYKKNYTEPAISEGIKEILKINPKIDINKMDSDYSLYLY